MIKKRPIAPHECFDGWGGRGLGDSVPFDSPIFGLDRHNWWSEFIHIWAWGLEKEFVAFHPSFLFGRGRGAL